MYHSRNIPLVLALAAGLLGGSLSRYITLPLHAQTQPANALEIRAQRFSIVDAQGQVIGTFTAKIRQETTGASPRPRIALVDPTGRELWSADGGGFKPLAEKFKVELAASPDAICPGFYIIAGAKRSE